MLAAVGVAKGGEQELIFVSGADAKVRNLCIAGTQKLLLVLPVEKNGVAPRPVLNHSDPLLFAVVLQKVAFMSADAQEKQVLSIGCQLAGQCPELLDDPRQVVSRLAQQPDVVTFMWSNPLSALPGLRGVASLWAGAAD